MAREYVEELAEWIRIPSVCADAAHADDVRRAGEWLCEKLRAAGGTAELVDWNGSPLAIGEIRASQDAAAAPTVLCYGHFDVQPPDPLELWSVPPFDATLEGEWLLGRGVADDKGQLFLLLKAAEQLASAGELPVNLRFACDGEEETGGHSIVDYLGEDERGADVAIIFDSDMVARGRPAFNVATRGLCYFHLTVRTGESDLHSGMYGGAALNGLAALTRTLSAVLPQEGRLPEPLRAGLAPPSDEERAAWSELPPGAGELATRAPGRSIRARPRSSTSARGPSPPSTSTGSRAGRRSCRRRCSRSRGSRTSRSASRRDRIRSRSRPSSSGCCARRLLRAPTSRSSSGRGASRASSTRTRPRSGSRWTPSSASSACVRC